VPKIESRYGRLVDFVLIDLLFFFLSFYCSKGSNILVHFGGNSLLYAEGGTQERQEECRMRKQSVPLGGDKGRLCDKRNLQLTSSSSSDNKGCEGKQ